MIGTILQNRYRIDALLGEGGMGVVYRGHDTVLERPVAVKVLAADALDVEGRARLKREARAAAALNHAHIVAVYDTGEQDGLPFVVMELVPGGSLRDAGALSPSELVEVGRQLCEALEHAHGHGIVHRDLKPENVLVSRDGDLLVVKLADLGVALTRHTARLTAEGTLVGTAWYFAPEQILGGALDGRADLYALGVVLYELGTGRLPFTGDDPLMVVSQHLYAPVVPPRTYRPELSPQLEAVILKLLAKRPEDRFASAGEVSTALANIAASPPSGTAPGAPEATDRLKLLDQLASGRLIGRRGELEQLRALWTRSQRGQGHMVLISGEPGVGKTRLARDILVYAQLSGATVVKGGCYEFEATTPYLPFVEALRQWVKTQETGALQSRLATTAAELARLAPEIEARLGPLAPSPTLSPQEERLRLFDSVARLFQSLAAERGLLVFLDDLHWADHGTVALLHYLLRNLRGERLLVLGAYREIELDRAHPLATALVDWDRERLATRIALGRLTLDDTSSMLAAMFGQDEVSRDFAEVVHRETEGNPFFVEEVIKSLIDHGQIYHRDGEWHREHVDDLSIPQSVKAAIGRRLNRLSPACIEVLHTAAALGKVFEFSELAAVAAGEEDRVLDALDEASTAQLVRPERDDAFAFTHDKIREVLHEELNPIRQRRLHQRIGETLERLHASDLDAHIQDLAYHFAESSDLRKGLDYSLAAATHAEQVYAHEEALEFLERARDCAEALESQERLAEVHERTARIHSKRGQSLEAAESYERALTLAVAGKRAALKGAIGEAYTRVGDARGLPYLEEALREFDPATQTNELALATANLGRFHHYRAQPGRAIEYLERALQLAEPLDDTGTVGLIYTYLAGAYQHLLRHDESMVWARRCIALGERKGDPLWIASGHEFLSEDTNLMGRWEESIAAALEDRRIGLEIGSQDRVVWAEFSRVVCFHGLGKLREAEEIVRDALALARKIGEGRLAIFLQAFYSTIVADLGRDDEARPLAENAAAEGEQIGQLSLRAIGYRALAYVLLKEGDSRSAAEGCEACLKQGEGTENRIYLATLLPTYAQALLDLGRLDEAAAVTERALALARESGSRHMEGIMMRMEGRRLAATKSWDEALAAFDASVLILDENGSRLELARALYQRGSARRERGDPTRAREDLERARALFAACGAAPECEAAATAMA